VSGARRQRVARLEQRRGGGERQRMEELVRSIFNPFEMTPDELALLVELHRRCPYVQGETDAQQVERWRRACRDADLPLFVSALARVPATDEAMAYLTLAVGDNCL
jgi:hypothetical protein